MEVRVLPPASLTYEDVHPTAADDPHPPPGIHLAEANFSSNRAEVRKPRHLRACAHSHDLREG